MERQLERLEHNLEKAEILVNGEIKPLEGEIDVDLENEIYDGMRYICDYDCKKLNTAL
ncbi:MAG: hypothetical protein LBD11_01370 [Candidatus Peribacteria bacterium]|jgi:hypothetical protein|nr:hypothetical protein [Candidatus Peribacteria bacterium]